MLLPRFKNTKLAYAISLLIGGIGFALIPFCPNQYLQIVPFLLIGCAWAAMLAMPFTFVTNALQGYGHMGAYLGLFNGTICIPQIIAALCGGIVLSLVGSHQSTMMIVSAFLLVIGAACVTVIRQKQ
jgi:maltose/moltooligosaccharide transporter